MTSGGRLGGACTAAIFLKRFVDGLIVDGSDNENQEGLIRWAHIDIAGTSHLASHSTISVLLLTSRCVCRYYGSRQGRWRLQPRWNDWSTRSNSRRVCQAICQGLD